MAVRELTLLLKARDEASQALGQTESRLGSLGKTAGLALAGIGVAAAGVGVTAIKMASEFEAGMREVNSMVGLGEKDFQEFSQEAINLSKNVGIAADQISGGLYQAISAGVPKENALTFLEIASKAAIAGVTDTETAVDGMTTVMNAFKLPMEETQKVADVMFATVKGGKTTFDQISGAMFNVAPLASAAGVKFEEVSAAIATLTKSGVPTSVATTQIRAAIQSIVKPGSEAKAIIENLGLEFTESALRTKGFGQFWSDVVEKTKGDKEILGKLVGSVEGLGAVLSITGEGAKVYASDLDAMMHATDGAGAATDAYNEINKGFSRQMETLKAKVSGVMIEIGMKLLPVITPLVTAIADNLGPAVDKAGELFGNLRSAVQPMIKALEPLGWFIEDILTGNLGALNDHLVETVEVGIMPLVEAFKSLQEAAGRLKNHLQPVLDALGEAIGKFLGNSDNLKAVLAGVAGAIGILIAKAAIAGLIALGVAMWNLAAAVIAATWPIIAIAAAITAAILIWQNWDKIIAFLGEQFERFRSMLSGAFTEALNKIGGVMESVGKAFSEAWDGLKEAVSTGLTNLVTTVQGWIATFLKPFQDAWNGISGAFSAWWASDKGLPGAIKTGLNLLVTTVQSWIEEIKKPFQAAWDAVSSIFSAFLGVGGDLLGAMGEGLEALASTVSGWLESFAQVFRDVWDGVTSVFSDFIGVAGSVLGLMGEGLGFLIDAVVGWVTDFKNSFLTVWQAVSDLFGPQLDNLVRLLGVGLQNMVDSVSGWIDTFLQPFREAWTGVMQLFDWFIGRSVVPDALQTGLSNMSAMVDTWGPGFANGFGQVWDDVERTASGAMNALANLNWPVAPKLSDAEIAEIMVGKMPNLKKIMEQGGKGDLSPLQMIQEWWDWPGVREGFGSFQEFAAGKGFLPKAGPGPSVTPSTKVLMDLFEKNYLPGFGTMEEGASAAVQQAAKLLAETTGGKVTASDADMQKWWNTIMSNALNDLLNRDIIGTARPSNPSLPRPSTPSLPPALPSASPGPGAAQTVAITINGVFLSPDRSIAQELARLLKPELDRLVTVGAG